MRKSMMLWATSQPLIAASSLWSVRIRGRILTRTPNLDAADRCAWRSAKSQADVASGGRRAPSRAQAGQGGTCLAAA